MEVTDNKNAAANSDSSISYPDFQDKLTVTKTTNTSSGSPKERNTGNVADGLKLVIDLNTNNLIRGLIMSEILGSPRAKRRRGNNTWNSRF